MSSKNSSRPILGIFAPSLSFLVDQGPLVFIGCISNSQQPAYLYTIKKKRGRREEGGGRREEGGGGGIQKQLLEFDQEQDELGSQCCLACWHRGLLKKLFLCTPEIQ